MSDVNSEAAYMICIGHKELCKPLVYLNVFLVVTWNDNSMGYVLKGRYSLLFLLPTTALWIVGSSWGYLL